ncbi:MAG: NYN domain-containing protein [Synechococcaceae cyanobacterium SM2_3_2]|nr:NYN domain-containing protein [Synechococcaceae cyanobacterium SM2_3_2]
MVANTQIPTPLRWWWTSSVVLGVAALLTRQVVLGLAPLAMAYPVLRRRDEQLQVLQSQQRRVDSQVAALTSQLHTWQQLPTSHLSIRQQLAPTTQAIQQMQRRLKVLELANHHPQPQASPGVSPEHLAQLETQLEQIQRQLESSPPSSPRKQVGVFIDGANLYASAQARGSLPDYGSLVPELTQGEVEVHFYSGVDPKNLAQRRFHRQLRTQGYRVVTKPVVTRADGSSKANLDGELIVDLMAMYPRYETVLLLSGDGDFAPALKHVRAHGVRVEVAAYQPDTHQELIRVADRFVDLRSWQGTGTLVSLPLKQTPAIS